MMVSAFSFFFPFLLLFLTGQSVLRRFGKSPRGRLATSLIGITSACLCLLPIGGVPLARWLISLNANFSLPLTAGLFAKAWHQAGGKVLLDRGALTSLWLFGTVMGLALYPMASELSFFDPYFLGWMFSPLFVFALALTVFLLIRRNRFGIVLLLCIITRNLQLLESPNFWDYLIDPFYVIASLIFTGRWLARGIRRRSLSSLLFSSPPGPSEAKRNGII